MLDKNIILSWLETGLTNWEKQATLSFLTKNSIYIPTIEANPIASPIQKNILLIAGLHLEEISGPKLLLDPEPFTFWRQHGYRFYIIPVVNQYGLNFKETSPDHLLRYNRDDINYNDGWGFTNPKQKTSESQAIEIAISTEHQSHPFDFAISFHEDSTQPNIGFIYTNSVSPQYRANLHQKLLNTSTWHLLSTPNPNPDIHIRNIDRDFFIVDDPDDGALENWLGEQLQIPTLLVEAPFGEPLDTKYTFQQNLLYSALNCL